MPHSATCVAISDLGAPPFLRFLNAHLIQYLRGGWCIVSGKDLVNYTCLAIYHHLVVDVDTALMADSRFGFVSEHFSGGLFTREYFPGELFSGNPELLLVGTGPKTHTYTKLLREIEAFTAFPE